ncbi:beta-glucosidase BglX [Aestuariivivens sediminicola]|uniref:beta-glucosidase BglX n=1 Tax=Aestuariivivens sediminicola TaxID=2913560 RepID=UPI001F55FA21|nr:beta-glucosidase BglX [Aestuariivivens sediminicola]
MNQIKIILYALLSTFLFQSCRPEHTVQPDDGIAQKVEALLSRMTLEEKVGQMNQYSSFYDVTGPAPSDGKLKLKYEHLKKGLVGSMLNVNGVKEVREFQKLAVENSRLGIPLIFGFDVIHGHKTLAPIPLAEAASWDLEAIRRSAEVAATEAAAMGINWTFAPMIDITRDARWGRVMEGSGEDPYLGTQIGVARVNGFQGNDLSSVHTLAACAKHLAGYGFSEAGKEYNTVDMSTSTLFNVVLPPFKAAVEEANVKTVMNAFNIMNGVPSTGNAFLQRDILKGRWGFDGFVISDWGSIKEIESHGMAANLKETAMIAANAGSDMDMESYAYVTHLADLVEEGLVSEDKIDEAVRRILTVKYELGLFDDPYKYCNEEREKELLYHPDHLEAVLDMARKSIVLLKNEGDLLPLKRDQKGIAVIGTLASDKNSPLGNWRLGSDNNTAVSVLEGLDTYCTYTYAKGADLSTGIEVFNQDLTINTSDKSGFKEAVTLAKNAEIVIMVLGEHGMMSGEARSRTQIDIPGVQQDLLEAVYEVNKNIVLVLMNGRPLAIPWAAEHIPAIVEAWQLGTQSGHAVADILFGRYNPSGKLPMSFPRSVGQCPIYYNYFRTGRPGPRNEVFFSRYIDEDRTPLYPFGYGLSYSKFDYSNLVIDDSDQKRIKVAVQVSNVSDTDGEEVVQLYINDKAASIVRPVKELKGFEKIALKAKTSQTVTFELTDKELGFYDPNGDYKVESGMFDVMVGTSSADGLTGSFQLK